MLHVLFAVIALLSFFNVILFTVILVRLFKEEGMFKGILGIIFGFYPFIWGWIKHRQLKLTPIMLLWTATFILPIFAGFAAFSTGRFAAEFKTLIPGFQSPVSPHIVQQRVKKPPVKKFTERPGEKGHQILPKELPASGLEKTDTVFKKTRIDYAFEMKKVNILLEMNDKRPDAYYNRGWLHENQGNLEKAQEDYTQALKLNKNDGDALYNRGLVFAKLKKYKEALDDFSGALKLHADTADALCNRGSVYFQTGKSNLALRDYNAALKIDPKDADLLYNRAIVYAALGEESKAREDLRKAARMMHDRTLEAFPNLRRNTN